MLVRFSFIFLLAKMKIERNDKAIKKTVNHTIVSVIPRTRQIIASTTRKKPFTRITVLLQVSFTNFQFSSLERENSERIPRLFQKKSTFLLGGKILFKNPANMLIIGIQKTTSMVFIFFVRKWISEQDEILYFKFSKSMFKFFKSILQKLDNYVY